MENGTCNGGVFRHRYVTVDELLIHVVSGGNAQAPAVMLLHGWPEDWSAWREVMNDLCSDLHVLAIDLPGIGGSLTAPPTGDKRRLAGLIGRLIEVLDLHDVTLVGSDIGGQIVYAAVREAIPHLRRAIIASVAVPGVEPWSEVVANPAIWHFALHAVPYLPEHLVTGRVAEYFDFFYDRLSADPARLTPEIRKRFADAYAAPSALHTGFEWYRAFARDERDNREQGPGVETPVLYLRGSEDAGLSLERYVTGLREHGLRNVASREIAGSGHFIAIEQPAAFARAIRQFVKLWVPERDGLTGRFTLPESGFADRIQA
jgi:pimeloyl-ACP methyl ester carboxylesterase